jgi:5-methylcytosine-specific restriction enzyme A
MDNIRDNKGKYIKGHLATSGAFRKGNVPSAKCGKYTRTKEIKNKISETLKKKGIKPIKRYSFPVGFQLPTETRKKFAPRGERHWNWKGGSSYKNRRIDNPEWIIIRKNVYERDNWICQKCGKHCKEKEIQCHHVIPYRICLHDKIDNLITLCVKCHAKEDRKL